jgi:hypothetical protein
VTTWLGVALVAILVGYWYLTVKMESEADRVSRGETVNGVGLFIPFIDVRAYRAEVTWLGEPARRPAAIDSPHLTYLGRGRDVVVLLACGRTTLVVPADQVIVNIQNQGHSDVDHEAQRLQFARACP